MLFLPNHFSGVPCYKLFSEAKTRQNPISSFDRHRSLELHFSNNLSLECKNKKYGPPFLN